MLYALALLLMGPIFTVDYQIDKTPLEIINQITATLPQGTGFHLPPNVAHILDITDAHLSIEWWPARHHGIACIEMLQAPDIRLARRLNRFVKTLDVRVVNGKTICHSTLDIGWGRERCPSNWALSVFVAPQVFALEQQNLSR